MQKKLDAVKKELVEKEFEEKALLHRLQREENRAAYLKKKERGARAHRLCSRGGAIEHFFPEIKELTEPQFFMLCERFFEEPETKRRFLSLAAQVEKEE